MSDVNSDTKIEILHDLPDPPASHRPGRVGVEKWPFSKLEKGDGFVIHMTDKHPEPWKSYQSLVSNAQRRFATKGNIVQRKDKKTGDIKDVQKYVPTKLFKIFPAEVAGENGAKVKVALVKRVA